MITACALWQEGQAHTTNSEQKSRPNNSIPPVRDRDVSVDHDGYQRHLQHEQVAAQRARKLILERALCKTPDMPGTVLFIDVLQRLTCEWYIMDTAIHAKDCFKGMMCANAEFCTPVEPYQIWANFSRRYIEFKVLSAFTQVEQ